MSYNQSQHGYPNQYPPHDSMPYQRPPYQSSQSHPDPAQHQSHLQQLDDYQTGEYNVAAPSHPSYSQQRPSQFVQQHHAVSSPQGYDSTAGTVPYPYHHSHPTSFEQGPPLPPAPPSYPSYNPQLYAAHTAPPPLPPASYGYHAGGAAPPPVPHSAYNPAAYAHARPPAPSESYQTDQQAQYRPINQTEPMDPRPPPVPARPHESHDSHDNYFAVSPPQSHQSYQSHAGTSSVPGTTQYPATYTPPAPPPPPPAISPSPDVNHRTYPTRTSSHAQSSSISSDRATQYAQGQTAFQQLPPLSTDVATGDFSILPNDPSHALHTPLDHQLPQFPPTNSSTGSMNIARVPLPPHRTDTIGRHPQARPLPGPPPISEHDTPPADQANGEGFAFDDILQEVEAAVMGHGVGPSQDSSAGFPPSASTAQQALPNRIDSRTGRGLSQDGQLLNGVASTNYAPEQDADAYSDDSDAEAEAGLAAMRLADEQDAAEEARRLSGTMHSRNASYQNANSPPPIRPTANLHRGYSSSSAQNGLVAANSHLSAMDPLHRHASSNSMARSDASSEYMSMPPADYSRAFEDSIHPFPAFAARTDIGETGGLAEPQGYPRRLSFEDGDEQVDVTAHRRSVDNRRVSYSTHSPSPAPARSDSRPLPPLPGNPAPLQPHRPPADSQNRLPWPQAPHEYENVYSSSVTAVQKANSTGTAGSSPQPGVVPARSITDGDQRRRSTLQNVRTYSNIDASLSPEAATLGNGKLGELSLPTIPAGRRQRFNPAKLSSTDFRLCAEPWAESAILAWLQMITEGESDLKESAIIDGIVALFTHKVPTMNTADAEALSAGLVDQMVSRGVLVRDEEWVRFDGQATMTGVIFQLTGTGCYAPRLHSYPAPGRCYSYHCMRTLKKVDLHTNVLAPARKTEDWATFYKLKKENIEGVPKKEIERQNNLHEIVTSEDYYMDQLDVLRILYREGLTSSQQPILSDKRLELFQREVFGRVDAVKKANEDFLLAQLKYRQNEQGPWIKGFSDIFREWIRKAKSAYIDYAAALPNATFLVRRESDRNVLFRQFLDQVRENERSRRLGWDTYLKAPVTRLQRYGLLLQTAQKNTVTEGLEKDNMTTAIEEIKAVTLECDARVAEMSKRSDLADLQHKLKLRPGMEKVQLNLNHLGREIVFRGDLQRRGNNKVSWLDTHAILFDHYLVLTKPIQQRDAAGGLKHEMLDVSKLPIPMDLLVLETVNDDPVVKSTVKGTVSAITSKGPMDSRSGKSGSSITSPGQPSHSSTSTSSASISSGKTLVATTSLESSNDKVLYPFRLKHLGKTDTYTLFAPSATARHDWCDKIIEAKTRHAASLFAQNAEPFRLRVTADTAFAYDSQSGGPRGVVIKGTPLDRAIEECERSFYGTGPKPGPVSRAQVNCATSFFHPNGTRMVAVGTDFGVFLSEHDNARGWRRAIATSHVTQVAILEDFSVCLIIADKSLIAYHLDQVLNAETGATNNTADASRRPPQRLSGNRDVGFFATGRMKDRVLVFYKKRDGISSTFKVLEPVYQKTVTTTRSRFGLGGGRKGSTDFFHDYDDFYIPSETYALNLFQTSLAIATARGIEVLTLDKKVPFSIPDLKSPAVASIAARIRDQKPLGMFRLSDAEFLLVFEEVGIYVDKHGDVSRAVVMEFVGRARQACLTGTYLVLVVGGSSSGGAFHGSSGSSGASGGGLVGGGSTGGQGGGGSGTGGSGSGLRTGFVEVRNADNGRLRQVIPGRDVRLLDDGVVGAGSRLNGRSSVKIAMQHPEMERQQVILELILNEGTKE